MTSARGRPSPGSPDLPPSGREISGLDEMCPIRWSPPISAAGRRPRTACPRASGPAGAAPAACGRRTQLLAVGEPAVDRRAPAPGAERARDRAQRGDHVARDAVAQHQRLGELVVALGIGAELLQHGREQVERDHLGARAAGEDPEQAHVVDVLVGDDDPLQVLDRVAVLAQRAVELVQRLARVRPGVDERQRVVLDQVAVDAPHGERRGDRQAVDVRGHERIRSSTSSRRRSMSCWETRLSRFRRSSGSVFDGRTLKCQSS